MSRDRDTVKNSPPPSSVSIASPQLLALLALTGGGDLAGGFDAVTAVEDGDELVRVCIPFSRDFARQMMTWRPWARPSAASSQRPAALRDDATEIKYSIACKEKKKEGGGKGRVTSQRLS